MEFDHGITLSEVDNGLLIQQYDQGYIARKWQLSDTIIEMVKSALDSGLIWMIREGLGTLRAISEHTHYAAAKC